MGAGGFLAMLIQRMLAKCFAQTMHRIGIMQNLQFYIFYFFLIQPYSIYHCRKYHHLKTILLLLNFYFPLICYFHHHEYIYF